jgi:hypothetical protein
MIKGTREKWAELFPIVQAFVEGKQIQRTTYHDKNKWIDTNQLHSMLSCDIKYRVKPAVKGTWVMRFEMECDQEALGTISKAGTEDVEPNWPGTISGMQLWPSSVKFIPDEK